MKFTSVERQLFHNSSSEEGQDESRCSDDDALDANGKCEDPLQTVKENGANKKRTHNEVDDTQYAIRNCEDRLKAAKANEICSPNQKRTYIESRQTTTNAKVCDLSIFYSPKKGRRYEPGTKKEREVWTVVEVAA